MSFPVDTEGNFVALEKMEPGKVYTVVFAEEGSIRARLNLKVRVSILVTNTLVTYREETFRKDGHGGAFDPSDYTVLTCNLPVGTTITRTKCGFIVDRVVPIRAHERKCASRIYSTESFCCSCETITTEGVFYSIKDRDFTYTLGEEISARDETGILVYKYLDAAHLDPAWLPHHHMH